jgi:hypothetical protein
MLYKFKRWVYVPCKTEVFIVAESDQEAIKSMERIDPKSLSFEECPMTHIRSTYEIVKSSDKKS